MPIKGNGWEIHFVREKEQARPSGKRRTVGHYQVFHDGVAQTGPGMSGMFAETRGPGDNAHAGNNRRVEPGIYPLWTQDGTKYKTYGYSGGTAYPKPGIELKGTGNRQEILIHPGIGFLASVGCINPCTSLPDANETIDFAPSRKRVIDIIEDMKQFIGAQFPSQNGKKIPGATAVIDGDPT